MRDLTFNYIVLRNGAEFGQIRPARDSAPVLRMASSGEIKSSLSGDFLPTVFDSNGLPMPSAEVNWLGDELQVEMVINGTVHPLGIFLPATVQTSEHVNGTDAKSLHVEAYDRCWRVKTTCPVQVFFASGVQYLNAIQALLTNAGLSLISAGDSAAEFTEARADWEIGTSTLTIVNELLSEINYNPLWFDQSGVAILEPISVPSAENIDHVLDAAAPDTLVLPGYTSQIDIFSTPNVFIAVCNNADKDAAMVATSENTNPQSPLSIARRGRRIVSVFNVNNIASQDELQAYADQLRNKSMIAGETITVRTGLLPGFGVNDVTALSYGDRFDICLEKAWSMELRPGGTMTHTLEKVVVNLG